MTETQALPALDTPLMIADLLREWSGYMRLEREAKSRWQRMLQIADAVEAMGKPFFKDRDFERWEGPKLAQSHKSMLGRLQERGYPEAYTTLREMYGPDAAELFRVKGMSTSLALSLINAVSPLSLEALYEMALNRSLCHVKGVGDKTCDSLRDALRSRVGRKQREAIKRTTKEREEATASAERVANTRYVTKRQQAQPPTLTAESLPPALRPRFEKLAQLRERFVTANLRNPSLRLVRCSQRQSVDLSALQEAAPGHWSNFLGKFGYQENARLVLCKRSAAEPDQQQLSRRLAALAQQVHAHWVELGVSDLAVGWPFLEGRANDGTWLRGPLLLYPVSLTLDKHKGPSSRWILSFAGPPQLNETLVHQLEKVAGVSLTLDALLKQDDDRIFAMDQLTWEGFLESLEQHGLPLEIGTRKLPKIAPLRPREKAAREAQEVGVFKLCHHMVLGRFPAASSRLVRDYDALLAAPPTDERLGLAACLLQVDERELTLSHTSTAAPRPAPSETPQASTTSQESSFQALRRWQALPSDSSQDGVFRWLATKDQRGLVVQGPPGTGKSQMIANVLGAGIAEGLRILVVSEKRAALDVVAERLESIGLREPVALVHDVYRERNEVCVGIAATIDEAQQAINERHFRVDMRRQSGAKRYNAAWGAAQTRLAASQQAWEHLCHTPFGRPTLATLQEQALQDPGWILPDLTAFAAGISAEAFQSRRPRLESLAAEALPLATPHPLHIRDDWSSRSAQEIDEWFGALTSLLAQCKEITPARLGLLQELRQWAAEQELLQSAAQRSAQENIAERALFRDVALRKSQQEIKHLLAQLEAAAHAALSGFAFLKLIQAALFDRLAEEVAQLTGWKLALLQASRDLAKTSLLTKRNLYQALSTSTNALAQWDQSHCLPTESKHYKDLWQRADVFVRLHDDRDAYKTFFLFWEWSEGDEPQGLWWRVLETLREATPTLAFAPRELLLCSNEELHSWIEQLTRLEELAQEWLRGFSSEFKTLLSLPSALYKRCFSLHLIARMFEGKAAPEAERPAPKEGKAAPEDEMPKYSKYTIQSYHIEGLKGGESRQENDESRSESTESRPESDESSEHEPYTLLARTDEAALPAQARLWATYCEAALQWKALRQKIPFENPFFGMELDGIPAQAEAALESLEAQEALILQVYDLHKYCLELGGPFTDIPAIGEANWHVEDFVTGLVAGAKLTEEWPQAEVLVQDWRANADPGLERWLQALESMYKKAQYEDASAHIEAALAPLAFLQQTSPAQPTESAGLSALRERVVPLVELIDALFEDPLDAPLAQITKAWGKGDDLKSYQLLVGICDAVVASMQVHEHGAAEREAAAQRDEAIANQTPQKLEATLLSAWDAYWETIEGLQLLAWQLPPTTIASLQVRGSVSPGHTEAILQPWQQDLPLVVGWLGADYQDRWEEAQAIVAANAWDECQRARQQLQRHLTQLGTYLAPLHKGWVSKSNSAFAHAAWEEMAQLLQTPFSRQPGSDSGTTPTPYEADTIAHSNRDASGMEALQFERISAWRGQLADTKANALAILAIVRDNFDIDTYATMREVDNLTAQGRFVEAAHRLEHLQEPDMTRYAPYTRGSFVSLVDRLIQVLTKEGPGTFRVLLDANTEAWNTSRAKSDSYLHPRIENAEAEMARGAYFQALTLFSQPPEVAQRQEEFWGYRGILARQEAEILATSAERSVLDARTARADGWLAQLLKGAELSEVPVLLQLQSCVESRNIPQTWALLDDIARVLGNQDAPRHIRRGFQPPPETPDLAPQQLLAQQAQHLMQQMTPCMAGWLAKQMALIEAGRAKEATAALENLLSARADIARAIHLDRQLAREPAWLRHFLRHWRGAAGSEQEGLGNNSNANNTIDAGDAARWSIERAWRTEAMGGLGTHTHEAPLVAPRQRQRLADELQECQSVASEGAMAAFFDRIIKKMRHPQRGVDMRVLGGMARKRRRRLSLRQLIREQWHQSLSTVRPIWLCSPESVSALFPLQEDLFDLIVIDEASQCTVESFLPVLARGKRVVIAGDEQQMPPSRFFQASYHSDLEEDSIALSSDSLLHLGRIAFPSTTLRWHYRSHHEALMAFSNHAFYGGKLLTAPQANPIQHPQVEGLHWRQVNGLWEDQQNLVEADAVIDLFVELVAQHATAPPSIGIVTLNRKQSELVEERLELRAETEPALAKAIAMDQQRPAIQQLFVRNLENVQGDERDVIIFSTGYGPEEPGGPVHARFGAIAMSGGEKRLNVAITRARLGTWVVSSFNPDRLDADNTRHPGPKLFLAYLQFVKRMAAGRDQDARRFLAIARSHSEGSHYASQTRQKLAEGRTGREIQSALTTKLRARGWEVEQSVGLGLQRLDLAVRAPTEERWQLGIDCSEFLHIEDPLTRDLYTPLFWQRLGWRIIRVTPGMWLDDPEQVIEEIEALLQNTPNREKQDS